MVIGLASKVYVVEAIIYHPYPLTGTKGLFPSCWEYCGKTLSLSYQPILTLCHLNRATFLQVMPSSWGGLHPVPY